MNQLRGFTYKSVTVPSNTTNPVPIILIDQNKRNLRNGILADIAPTVLEILGVEKPLEMTGKSLIRK